MAMETRLALKQRQQLVMTPALQMAINLLQLSTLELQEVLQQELIENPVLEEVQEDAGEEELSTPPGTSAVEASDEARSESPADDLPFDLSAILFDTPDDQSLVDQEEREAPPLENVTASAPTLAAHLLQQLHIAVDDDRRRRIGEIIIGNLDDDGYLRVPIDDLATDAGVEAKVEAKEVEAVLAVIQSFDPVGVAARDAQECILLQLTSDPEPDPVAIEIATTFLGDLERRRYPEIARALGLPVERVMEAVEVIEQLEPKPGRRFGQGETRYIVPDVYIIKDRDRYRVVLNEDNLPRLRINGFYRGFMGRGNAAETRAYLEQKFRSALWLIKSLHQRQRTLYRVTESIVKHQREFLDRGTSHLRPMALRHVAEDIEMHESTVSRVTSNKYVHTPQGLYELKFFFHSGLATGEGGLVSSVAVKKMISELIAKEESQAPLSDQGIARHLKGRGLSIARRTVAKYREELRILPSHQRRLAVRKRRTED